MRFAGRSILTALTLLVFVTLATAASQACNKTFVVYNRTDNSIVRLYVSPHASRSWEDNVLSSTNSIEPDTYKNIDMSADTRDLSLYDVKAIFDDGTYVQGGKINVCRARSVYVYDDRITYSD